MMNEKKGTSRRYAVMLELWEFLGPYLSRWLDAVVRGWLARRGGQ